MGRVTLRNYPNQILHFNLPEIESDPVKIKIHMVRVYNDGETIISILCLRIEGANHYYATVTNETTSPAREGEYLGYLIRRNDSDDEDDVNHPDSQKNKQRIENIFEKLNKFDERLPKEYQNGKQNYNYGGHNGLRIFQHNMPFKKFTNWTRINGGNRFFHVANYASSVIGCEGVGFYAKMDDEYSEYAVWESVKATGDFLNNIIETYEENITKKEQSTIEIDIEVEDNIQKNMKKGDRITPENLYNKLYPPREKVKAIEIKPHGIKL